MQIENYRIFRLSQDLLEQYSFVLIVCHVEILGQQLLNDFITELSRIICIVMAAIVVGNVFHNLSAELQLFVEAFGNVIGEAMPRSNADLSLSFVLLLLIDMVVLIIIII